MGTVAQLTQLSFTPNQAKHLALDGIDLVLGGWTPGAYISSANNYSPVALVGTYASGVAFTVPGDITSYVQAWDKIKFTQPTLGVKYGYVQSVSYGAPNTTITLVTNSDYSVANEAITDIYFSRQSLPYGFPEWFFYAPNVVGFSSVPSSATYRFKIDNKECTVVVRQPNNGTSDSVNFQISSPVTAKDVSGTSDTRWGTAMWYLNNSGVGAAAVGVCYIIENTANILLFRDGNLTAWTNSGGKSANFTLKFEI